MPVDPSPTMLEKIFGPKKRKKDIVLPNESGKKDPRLRTVMDSIREATSNYGELKKKGIFK